MHSVSPLTPLINPRLTPATWRPSYSFLHPVPLPGSCTSPFPPPPPPYTLYHWGGTSPFPPPPPTPFTTAAGGGGGGYMYTQYLSQKYYEFKYIYDDKYTNLLGDRKPPQVGWSALLAVSVLHHPVPVYRGTYTPYCNCCCTCIYPQHFQGTVNSIIITQTQLDAYAFTH